MKKIGDLLWGLFFIVLRNNYWIKCDGDYRY